MGIPLQVRPLSDETKVAWAIAQALGRRKGAWSVPTGVSPDGQIVFRSCVPGMSHVVFKLRPIDLFRIHEAQRRPLPVSSSPKESP